MNESLMETKGFHNKLKSKLLWLWSEHSIVIVFIFIFILAAISNDSFLSVSNLMNIVRQSSIIGIVSLGMSLVILTGGIDLSVGSGLAFVGGVYILTLNSTGNIFVAIIVALLLGGLIGLFNGVLVAKGKIASFIVTLGTMAAARSLILYIAKGGSITGKTFKFGQIANGQFLGIAYPIYIFIILTIIVSIVVNRTKFGRYIYAIGSNEKAALLSAIDVDSVKVKIYVICGMLTGLAAIIEASRLNSISSASSGSSYELDAIAAVIIGGTRMSGGKGAIWGTFLGILILGVFNNIMNLMNISPYLQGLVKGIIIIGAVLFQKKE